MSNLESNALIEALNRAKSKKPSAEDVVDTLFGRQKKSSSSIAKPGEKRTEAERSARIAKIKSKRDAVGIGGSEEVDTIDHIPEIAHLPQIPDGFPEGTVLNDDGTLTLPDGRMIRKKQEVDHG